MFCMTQHNLFSLNGLGTAHSEVSVLPISKVPDSRQGEATTRARSFVKKWKFCPEHNLLCFKILDLGLPGCTLQQYLGLVSWEAQSFLHFRKHTMNNEVKRSFPLPSKSFLLCVHPPHRNQGRIVIRVFVIPLENIVDVSKERQHRKNTNKLGQVP